MYSAGGDYLVKSDSPVGWVRCSNSLVFMLEPGTLRRAVLVLHTAPLQPAHTEQEEAQFEKKFNMKKALVRSVTIIKTSLFSVPLPFKHNSPVSSSFRKDSSFLSLQ